MKKSPIEEEEGHTAENVILKTGSKGEGGAEEGPKRRYQSGGPWKKKDNKNRLVVS